MKQITIPAMGESISEAVIGQIFKPSGSKANTDDELLELETDKVNSVIYVPATGTITLDVKTGDRVKIGQVIGKVEEGEGNKEPEPEPKIPEQSIQKPEPEPKIPEQQKPEPSKTDSKVRIGKEALFEDPQSQEVPEVPKQGESRKKMSQIRKTISARLVEAKTQTAMLTTFNEVDMSEVIRLREKYKESFLKREGVKLGFLSFFVKALVSALETFPSINSQIEGDEIVSRDSIDIGIAVSTGRGLVVPNLRNAQDMSIAEIEKGIEAFAKKARDGSLSLNDLKGGTFTLTNGGTFGSLLSTPILNFPQSGILGLHKIEKRAVVIDDQIEIRPMMYVALTYDHRIVDGREAVLFLVHIKELIEDPGRFIIDE